MPLGLLTTALVGGLAAARRAVPLGLTAPRQAAEAYLLGWHGLAPESARLALRRAAYFTAIPLLAILSLGVFLVSLALR